MENIKILFLEDNEFDLELIKRELLNASISFTYRLSATKEEFIDSLSTFFPDIILSDHSLPQFDSLSALRIVKENYPHIPFVLVTGSVSEEFAVTCIKEGAEDYILKRNLMRLPSLIANVMNKTHLKKEFDIIKSLNEELRKTQQIISQKNKDITDSIEYARQIQNSILPEKRLFLKMFPEAFILYRPKDIVSGDFYWFTEYNDNYLVAIGDCTGHGVPGAMLSMIGYHMLNNIIHLRNITRPQLVLEELNRGICEVFKQGKSGSSISDGMDISFCSIDNKNNTLEYAGARRPVYIVGKNGFMQIKGCPFSIGGMQSEKLRYKNNTVKLDQGDKIYMFTDGYTDQFGGKNNKKMKARKFREILKEISAAKMSTQKRILNDYFNEWKNGFEQTDDILVVGIEIQQAAIQSANHTVINEKKWEAINKYSVINTL